MSNANRISEVTKFIIAHFKNNLSVPVYNGIAPEGVCHPFVNFSVINDTPYRTTCGNKGTFLIQFSVFEKINSLSQVHLIIDDIRDNFDDLSGTGIQLMQYNNSFLIQDEDNKGWQGVVQYTVYTD